MFQRRLIRPVLLLLALALGAGLYLLGPGWFSPAKAPQMQAGPNGKPTDTQSRPVPVVTAQVIAKAMPVSFPATGSIEAIASVVVKSRVDGEITRIAANDGSRVAAGDVLAEIDARLIDAEIAAAQANLARDEATRAKAARDLARARDLLARNAVTAVAVTDAETALALADAALAASKANSASLATQREFYTIRAPISGQIGVIAARPGSNIRAADATALTTIIAFDPVYVAIGVPQREIAALAKATTGGTAMIRVSVPGAKPGTTVSGPVSVIGNEAAADTGLITVRASIANPGPVLWPGEVVDAEVIIGSEANALVAPNIAVQTSQKGPYVYRIDANGVAHVTPVVIARSVGEESIIAQGLKEGDVVVTDGQLQLTDKAMTAGRQAGG